MQRTKLSKRAQFFHPERGLRLMNTDDVALQGIVKCLWLVVISARKIQNQSDMIPVELRRHLGIFLPLYSNYEIIY